MRRIKHTDARHLWSQESLRKGLFGLDVIGTSMNTADMGTKYLCAPTRRTLMALMPLCLWKEVWAGYDGGRFERRS